MRELDPNYREAMLLKARTYIHAAQWDYGDDVESSLKTASAILDEARSVDAPLSESEKAEIEILEAYIDQVAGRFDAALTGAVGAAADDPNNAYVQAMAGFITSLNQRYDESIEYFHRAIGLNPIYPSWYAIYLSRDYAFLGEKDLAIEWAEEGVDRSDNDSRRSWALVNLAVAYELAGRNSDAKAAVKDALALAPNTTIDVIKSAQPFRDAADWAKVSDALKSAGLPE